MMRDVSQRPDDIPPEVWEKTLLGAAEKLHDEVWALGRLIRDDYLIPLYKRLHLLP